MNNPIEISIGPEGASRSISPMLISPPPLWNPLVLFIIWPC